MKTKTCPKCNGSGLYVQYMVDGVPMSSTGTTCFKCNGHGKITISDTARRIRCPKCKRMLYNKITNGVGFYAGSSIDSHACI